VRSGVAGNPVCPPEGLRTLVRASSDPVLVASHPETPDDRLAGLMASEAGVRVALAKRPYLPGLQALAGDPRAKVRAAVASGRGTPPDLLAALALDPDVKVRKAVHSNKSATAEARAQAVLLGV